MKSPPHSTTIENGLKSVPTNDENQTCRRSIINTTKFQHSFSDPRQLSCVIGEATAIKVRGACSAHVLIEVSARVPFHEHLWLDVLGIR
jgi:hypothetical protein